MHKNRKAKIFEQIKYTSLALAIFFVTSNKTFALPGIESSIKDISGEYCYYEDNPFERKSYIGFLYYDDSTYSVRYYAPSDLEKGLVEHSVQLFVSVNKNADYLELTGEKFSRQLTPKDSEVVNYMHDMLYELHARRKKLGNSLEATSQSKFVADNFHQFGGSVILEYSALVPIFNLKKITNAKNQVSLQLVTIGKLENSSDTSFEKFTGFPQKYTNAKNTFRSEKKIKSRSFKTSEQKIVKLDSQWEEAFQNVWSLKEIAILSALTLEAKPSEDSLVKFLRYNVNAGRTIDWKTLTLKQEKGAHIINVLAYDANDESTLRIIDILVETPSNYNVFRLAIFNNEYEANKKYFDTLVKNLSKT